MSDSSPLAKGGAGVDFEIEVGAIYLASLLAGTPARGATGGRVVEVRFQQPISEAPLDDLVVETAGVREPVRLDLQRKRSFAFRPSDGDFESVVEACWSTFQKPAFESPAVRFGIAIQNAPQKVWTDYVRVPEWARANSSSEDFFRRIETEELASALMREFVTRIADHLRNFAGDPSFLEIYDKWVEMAAHHPWGFRTLLTFAEAPGSRLPAFRLIGWFHQASKNVADPERLWREKRLGETMAVQLRKLWRQAADEIRGDSSTLRQLADICDDLARAGVALAAKLRRDLG